MRSTPVIEMHVKEHEVAISCRECGVVAVIEDKQDADEVSFQIGMHRRSHRV